MQWSLHTQEKILRKAKKKKTHDVEQSSNAKDEVEQHSCKNMTKGFSPNDKYLKEGENTDHEDDEVDTFYDAQNGEEIDEAVDAQDSLIMNPMMVVF